MNVGDYVTLIQPFDTRLEGLIDTDYVLYVYACAGDYQVKLRRGGPNGDIFDPNRRGNDIWSKNYLVVVDPPNKVKVRDVHIIRYIKELK